MDVRVIGDRAGRPLVAFATIRFRAIGVASGAEIPIRHDGAYVLRRSDAGWRVTGYDVASRVPSPDEVEEIVKRHASRADPPPIRCSCSSSGRRPGAGTPRARPTRSTSWSTAAGPRSIVGIPGTPSSRSPDADPTRSTLALTRGTRTLVDTVERLSGVRIDAYVLTGFAGFERIIGTVGRSRSTSPTR
jgi:hypothetical protein